MKKMFLFLIIASTFSCAKKVSQENVSKTSEEPKKEVSVGGDPDSHGCKASAGYNWSTLKKECIRIFEGTKLSHYDDGKTYTTASYVIFDGNKAELFLDTQKESIILERKSEGDSWKKDNLELIPWKGYVLKKDGKIIYTGK
ncbi:hypothetical protein [Flavobacterium reichenbachii]|uniref:Lipoprotein n=1 Tax=Flavobacterium reichenbachii TaxID=362418 RepID=A0A085ZNE5_9FLAO|nr:hypothetical protein [Flavobacterium reichenbachii]KFF05959.1 hypothetical protein IW19_10685 [Flavobacterium reichenbachii]